MIFKKKEYVTKDDLYWYIDDIAKNSVKKYFKEFIIKYTGEFVKAIEKVQLDYLNIIKQLQVHENDLKLVENLLMYDEIKRMIYEYSDVYARNARHVYGIGISEYAVYPFVYDYVECITENEVREYEVFYPVFVIYDEEKRYDMFAVKYYYGTVLYSGGIKYAGFTIARIFYSDRPVIPNSCIKFEPPPKKVAGVKVTFRTSKI